MRIFRIFRWFSVKRYAIQYPIEICTRCKYGGAILGPYFAGLVSRNALIGPVTVSELLQPNQCIRVQSMFASLLRGPLFVGLRKLKVFVLLMCLFCKYSEIVLTLQFLLFGLRRGRVTYYVCRLRRYSRLSLECSVWKRIVLSVFSQNWEYEVNCFVQWTLYANCQTLVDQRISAV